eukprot:7119907-Prymnesium_polylepis.2
MSSARQWGDTLSGPLAGQGQVAHGRASGGTGNRSATTSAASAAALAAQSTASAAAVAAGGTGTTGAVHGAGGGSGGGGGAGTPTSTVGPTSLPSPAPPSTAATSSRTIARALKAIARRVGPLGGAPLGCAVAPVGCVRSIFAKCSLQPAPCNLPEISKNLNFPPKSIESDLSTRFRCEHTKLPSSQSKSRVTNWHGV